MAKFIRDGAVELYHNNVKKFETSSRYNIIAHGTEGIRLNVIVERLLLMQTEMD